MAWAGPLKETYWLEESGIPAKFEVARDEVHADRVVRRLPVQASADDDGWAKLGPVGSRITNEGPFDHRTYGFNKLVDLFAAIDLFEVRREKHEGHTVVSVRLVKMAGKKIAGKKGNEAH